MRNRSTLLCTAALLLLGAAACGGEESPSPSPSETPTPTQASPTPTATATATPCTDGDGDGVCLASDCDDANDAALPGGIEVCDGADNNCDGATDEGVLPTWYQDSDADGYGQDGATQSVCEQPAGYTAVGGDCDDTRRAVNPSRPDGCDGLDNDCDSSTDEAPDEMAYTDGDGDGYGDSSTGVASCTLTEGQAAVGGDCADADAEINPGELEIWANGIDEDCDNADRDGNVYVMSNGDLPPEQGAPTFTGIQAAIDTALTGQTIGVGPGTYVENLDFKGKNLQIISLEGPEVTIVDGSGDLGPVVLFNSGEGIQGVARLEGFTLTGGTGSPGGECGFAPGFRYGGGICIRGSSPTIAKNIIEGNAVDVVEDEDGDPISLGGSGGGIYAEDSTSRIYGNVFRDNYAFYDAGGLNFSTAEVEVFDNLIVGNGAARSGGAMVIFDCAADVHNNVIVDNYADGSGVPPQAGGIYVNDADPIIEANIIAYNTAGSSGGGIGILNTALQGILLNNTIVGNKAIEEGGGGLNVNTGTIAMSGNIFAFNQAAVGSNIEVTPTSLGLSGDFNLFWQPDASSGVQSYTLSGSDVIGDPAFVDDPSDFDATDDDFTLLSTSRAIDMADPDAARNDVDGTRGDAGAYGGPRGASFTFTYADAVAE